MDGGCPLTEGLAGGEAEALSFSSREEYKEGMRILTGSKNVQNDENPDG